MKNNRNSTSKKLTISIALIIILSLCLCMTTYALVQVTVTVKDSVFNSGAVKINLNDGKPVIEEHEFLFKPGMTVKKDFFIENQSTTDVYYKLYFTNVNGGLADVLEITVKDGDKTLYSGKAADLSRENSDAADDMLRINERRELTVYFYFPAEAGNETQNLVLSFSLNADAVQTKNNPNRLFN